MPQRYRRFACLSVAALALAAGAAQAALVEAEIVLKQNDPLGESTVSSLNTPFTDGAGRVGFVAALADNQRAIWWNDGPVFLSNDALPDVLTGGEGTMGVGNAGQFIYSPSFNGGDAVYTNGGKLLADDDPIPSLPGLYSTFNSRPTMLPDGTAHWVGGTSEVQGGSSTNRHLFRATDPTDPNSIVRLLGGGDVIEGKTVKTSASNFDYWISDNGIHHIQVLDMDVTLNEHVYLDGLFVAQEGGDTGEGDYWSAFDIVSVNDSGDYIFTGDTDGPTTNDEFIACNGTIAVREGDTLDGVTLPSGAALRAASINNDGFVAHMWGSGSNEWLFYGPADDLMQSVLVLAVGDEIDIDGDEIGDYAVTDMNASTTIGPGLDLASDGFVYLEVDILETGGSDQEAILRVPLQTTSSVADARWGADRLQIRCAPNPAPGATDVLFRLDEAGEARLAVFDGAGRRIRDLHIGARPAGENRIAWDGRDAQGAPVPAGVYFVRASAEGRDGTARAIILR